MSEVVFNNLSGFFKNYLYIGDYADVWEVFFGLTLCHNCKNPNSRVCCAPCPGLLKTTYILEVMLMYGRFFF